MRKTPFAASFEGRRVRRSALALAGMITISGLLSACSTAADPGTTGDGIAPGASKEEYIAALADIDPITVTMSTSAAPGTAGVAAEEAYKAAVEEWSDGKITVEIGYGGSIASLPQHEAALRDGRLQISTLFAAYQPDTYRAFSALMSVANQADATPHVGYLQSFGAMVETAWNTEELIEEYEANGLVPLLPYMATSPLDGLFCASPITSIADAAGVLARTSNRPGVEQLEAVGMTPVDVAIPEVFEAYQRGVIDCSVGNLKTQGPNAASVASLGGAFTYSPEIGFVPNAYALVADEQFWTSIPLAARQLLWDRVDVYTAAHIEGGVGQDIEALEDMLASGVEFLEWEQDIVDALVAQREKSETVIADGGTVITDPDFVTSLKDVHAQWRTLVAELGYTEGGSVAELAEWADFDEIDLSPYSDAVIKIAPSERRPG